MSRPENQFWCPKTDQPLWETTPTGADRYLAPHGQCCFCNGWYHTDVMHSSTTHSHPIRILGGWCKKCYALPLPPKDPLRSIKLEAY